MKKSVFSSVIVASLVLLGCEKDTLSEMPLPSGFETFTIQKGEHFSDQSIFKSVTILSGIFFSARFNTSAIYQTKDPANQEDINKLWGFSEGEDHQLNSARIGWAYCRDSLRLYGYTYAGGKRHSKEICTIDINRPVRCGIELSADGYRISVGDKTVVLPRERTTLSASGYQLYPYFGGDETAPHTISIDIQTL
jgi:hypothetical protein